MLSGDSLIGIDKGVFVIIQRLLRIAEFSGGLPFIFEGHRDFFRSANIRVVLPIIRMGDGFTFNICHGSASKAQPASMAIDFLTLKIIFFMGPATYAVRCDDFCDHRFFQQINAADLGLAGKGTACDSGVWPRAMYKGGDIFYLPLYAQTIGDGG